MIDPSTGALRLGFFYLPWTGHLNPLAGLAGELESRGHQAIFFNLPEFAEEARARGLRFQAYAAERFRPGSFGQRLRALSALDGEAAMRAALEISRDLAEAFLEEAADVIREARLDLWVVDQMDYAAATLAARLKAPFVTAVVTLMRQTEPGVPGFSGRSPDPPAQAAAVRPFLSYLDDYRRRHGMPAFAYETLWSNLAQISQQPAEFEFPRRHLPECFHFTGPFTRPQNRPRLDFPWERLDGRPLIYASLGTAHTGQPQRLQQIIEACRGLDAQLVMAVGDCLLEAPPDVVALPAVPQLQLLPRCRLMITHGGMNSVLECLQAGLPMVALPVAHDQPGIAARIEWSGVGLSLPARDCQPGQLRELIQRVLQDPSFGNQARRLKRCIEEGPGLAGAADLVEQVMRTGKPVLRSET